MKSYYQKFFEDYEEERVPNRNGKGTHIEYTYVGYYFRLGMRKAVRILLRILYAMIGIGIACCLFFAGSNSAKTGSGGVSVLLQAAAVLAMIWFFWVLCNYLAAPGDMTIYQYKSTALQMQRVSLCLAVLFALNFAAAGMESILGGVNLNGDARRCLLCYLLGGVGALALTLTERMLPYQRLSNQKNVVWNREQTGWRCQE